MAQYVVSGGALQVKAGATFDLRIISINYYAFAYNGATSDFNVNKYTGSPTQTGGSILTPTVAREGPAAPTAGFTIKTGATIGGTYSTFNIFSVTAVPGDPAGTSAATNLGGTFSPPVDFILRAGSSSLLTTSSAVSMTCTIYLEELRIFWSL